MKKQGLLIQLIDFLINFAIDTNRCYYNMGNDTENIRILCIGVGGAGTNVINRMKDIGYIFRSIPVQFPMANSVAE